MIALPALISAVANLGSPPDLLRLLAVPVFGWAAYRDVRTRRVPNETWVPLALLGVALLAWEAWRLADAPAIEQSAFAVRVAMSVGIVAPLGYVFWRLGGFGGADAKAIMTIAVLFPTYPTFTLPWATTALPAHPTLIRVFSLTILSNTVILGALYPVVLAIGNALRGRAALAMFVGRPVPVDRIPEEYGRLLETTDGFTRRGLDVDALRMYLRWRGATFADLRAAPDRFRDPRTLPAERHDPGDGSIEDGPPVADGGRPGGRPGDDSATPDGPPGAGRTRSDSAPPSQSPVESRARDRGQAGQDDTGTDPTPAIRRVDWWGAETFLSEIEGTAYGTSPEQLREGLSVLSNEDTVWLTPGIPFIVPMFGGLVAALTFGDVLFFLLQVMGLVP